MADLDPRLTPVEPIGERKTQAFVDWHDDASGMMHGELREIVLPVYPSSMEGKRLRDARVAAGLGLTKASELFGMSAENISGLERGRYTLRDSKAWDDLHAALSASSGRCLNEGKRE